MSSGNVFERLFKLWASVCKMVLDGKRAAEEVCRVLQAIVDGKTLVEEKPAIGETLALPPINPVKMYETLGMSAEYAEFIKTNPIPENPNLWTLPVLQGLTCNKLVAAMKTLGAQFYLYADDLDKAVPTNDRDPNRDGSYIVSFARNFEADEENKNQSANSLAKAGHKGITLLERLLLGLGYFLATGKHLDESNWALCSGSRYGVGSVPHVYWDSDDRKVFVSWDFPGDRDSYLRSRSVRFLPS